jgi:hypothetical protein
MTGKAMARRLLGSRFRWYLSIDATGFGKNGSGKKWTFSGEYACNRQAVAWVIHLQMKTTPTQMVGFVWKGRRCFVINVDFHIYELIEW